MRRDEQGFTLVEILVSIAILVILFGLMLRPIMMGLEVISIGRGEQQAQLISRSVTSQLESDLQSALEVYPNLATYDLASADGRWRTPQTSRLDLILPARGSDGKLLTPIRPDYANDDPRQPVVVTYWRMRTDPTKDYDPELNPYRLWRAIHSYNSATVPEVRSPDDLWDYGLDVAKANGVTLQDLWAEPQISGLFASGGPFDWFIADLDKLSPSAAAPIMRGPVSGATYSNASRIQALTSLTPLNADLRQFDVLPALSQGEELEPNSDRSSYQADWASWIQPYQRASGGRWTLPSSDVIPRNASTLGLPLVAMFRARGGRSDLLTPEYFVSIVQDTTSARVGHPVLYRMHADTGADPVLVYDLTDYPKRVFAAPPGEALSAEFACGIDWERGRLVTDFPQLDVICPADDLTIARIHAQNDFDSTNAVSLPVYQAGTDVADSYWQSLPLTSRDSAGNPQVGVDQVMLDDYVLDALGSSSGVWDSYTLSAFRPHRLRTGTDRTQFDGAGITARQLDMSVVPGSVEVVVVQYSVADVADVAASQPVKRVSYTPMRAGSAGAIDAGSLAPFRYYLDPGSGRLTFYDPQLDDDAVTARDGLNPPAVIDDPSTPGNRLVPVIYVTYKYRNNLPTAGRLLLGDDSTRDVVEASYRSLESIELRMVLDVPTESTRGDGETIDDPLAASPIERPTGARKRVAVQTVFQVGNRL